MFQVDRFIIEGGTDGKLHGPIKGEVPSSFCGSYTKSVASLLNTVLYGNIHFTVMDVVAVVLC